MEELRAQFLSSLPNEGMIPSSDEDISLLFLSNKFVYEPARRGQLLLRRPGRRLLISSSAFPVGWVFLNQLRCEGS